MKMPQIVNLNPQFSRVERELSARIWVVFGRFPDLCGFSLQDRTSLPDYIDTSSLRDELFVTELGFSAPVSELEYDEAYQLIHRRRRGYRVRTARGLGAVARTHFREDAPLATFQPSARRCRARGDIE